MKDGFYSNGTKYNPEDIIDDSQEKNPDDQASTSHSSDNAADVTPSTGNIMISLPYSSFLWLKSFMFHFYLRKQKETSFIAKPLSVYKLFHP